MDPLTMAMIGAGLANVLGGIFGGNAAAAEAEKAQALLQSTYNRINALPIPQDIKNDIMYQQFMVVGDYTPQSLDKTLEEYAPLALLIEPPENKLKQQQLYAQVEQATKSGLSPQDKLIADQARRKVSQGVLSRMATAKSAAQQQGKGAGSGQEIAEQISAIQSGADREAQENMQMAANAWQQQQANIQNLVNMASNFRQQDLNVNSANTQAKNLRNELMMKYATDRSKLNFGQRVSQQEAYRNALQNAANANVQTSQQEAYRKNYLAPMELFKLQMQKEQGLSDVAKGMANVHLGLGGAKAQAWSQAAGGVGTAMLAGGGAYQPAAKATDATNNLMGFNYDSAPKISSANTDLTDLNSFLQGRRNV